MSQNNIFDSLQQSFRVTLGAVTSVGEAISDPQKREDLLSQETPLEQRFQEWETKGEQTEREARQTLESFLQRPASESPSPTSNPRDDEPISTPSTRQIEFQAELQALIDQVVELRDELARERESIS